MCNSTSTGPVEVEVSSITDVTLFVPLLLLLLPAPLLNQVSLSTTSGPSAAVTRLTHELEKGTLLPPIREPAVAHGDRQKSGEPRRDPVVALGDANECTYVRQCGILHCYCSRPPLRSKPW